MNGIKFNTQAIQSILDGRKTQTRRAIKEYVQGIEGGKPIRSILNENDIEKLEIKPKYKIGETIFVQEDFYIQDFQFDSIVLYDEEVSDDNEEDHEFRPASEMTEKEARIFLKITNIKVERLQDISAHDCKAEGVPFQEHKFRYKELFEKDIWDKLPYNHQYDWNSNPYVFVYEFERVENE